MSIIIDSNNPDSWPHAYCKYCGIEIPFEGFDFTINVCPDCLAREESEV